MPEFHIIFFFSLLIIKLLLIFSLLLSSTYYISFSSSPNILITTSMVMAISSFAIDLYVSVRYWKKWRSYSKNAPSILKNKNV